MSPVTRRKPGRPAIPQLAERRREEILGVAQKVFARKGYPGTDVQIVADEIKIGKGTIYRYFPTKERLFLATVDRGMRLLRASVEQVAEGVDDPLERIVLAVQGYLAFFDHHSEIVELLIQERAEFKNRKKPTYFAYRDASLDPWQGLFRQLIADGRVRDIPVERITDVLSDLLYGTIFTNLFSGRRKSLEAQAQDILDVVSFGILTEEERDRGCNPGLGGRTT